MTTEVAPENRQPIMEEEQNIDDEEQQRRKMAMKVHLQQHKDKRKQHILAKRRPATLGMGGFETIKANAALLATAPDLRTELHHSNTAASPSLLHPSSAIIPQQQQSPNNIVNLQNNANSSSSNAQQQNKQQQQHHNHHIESTANVSNSTSASSSKEMFSAPSASNGPTPTSSSPSSNTNTNSTNPTITFAPEDSTVKTHHRRGSGSASNDKLPVMTKSKQDQPQKVTNNSADLRRRASKLQTISQEQYEQMLVTVNSKSQNTNANTSPLAPPLNFQQPTSSYQSAHHSIITPEQLRNQFQNLHHLQQHHQHQHQTPLVFPPPPPKIDPYAELRKQYHDLIEEGNKSSTKLDENLNKLRRLVLLHGLPPETDEERVNAQSKLSLRAKVWLILLRVKKVDTAKYTKLVEKGSSSLYQKIRNDTFRTFKNDNLFKSRVPEEKLIRVLNAFLHSLEPRSSISYVQGMNVAVAPFLYVMPELEAFYAFSQFAKFHCPLYFNAAIEGAFSGLKLVDEIMKEVDGELHSFLNSQQLKADVWAMPPVLSFSGSTPPL